MNDKGYMKASVRVSKEPGRNKDLSRTRCYTRSHQHDSERQLGSLREVIGMIKRNGGTPSVDSIATELSPGHSAERTSVLRALQQTHGNRYVQRVVAGVQARMKVSQPGDIYEQEADRVAEMVTWMPFTWIQRTCPACEKKETAWIMRQKGPESAKGEPPKTTKDPAKIAGTVLDAFFKTDTGKKVEKKLKEAATSKEGITFLSMMAVPTLATMYAEKMEMPQALVDLVPKFAKIELGKDMELTFQPIYKGKLGERPAERGGKVVFTIKWW